VPGFARRGLSRSSVAERQKVIMAAKRPDFLAWLA
jgi:hypothetical protein